jgi:hypothetical protein
MPSSRATIVRTAAALSLFAIGFGTGFIAYRYGPTRQFFKRIAIRLGWSEGQNRAPIEVDSPSLPATVLSLPYVQGTIDRDRRRGVVAYDPGRAFDGLNLYTSTGGDASLIDMRGRVVYRWSNLAHLAPTRWYGTNSFWEFSHLFPDGRLLALRVNTDLVALDRKSRVLWTCKGRFHHDLAVNANGDIYALVWEARVLPEIHPKLPTIVDYLVILSADGVVRKKISLLDVFRRSPYAFLMPSVRDLQAEGGPNREIDLLHANHVEIVGDGSPFPRGSLLLSMRNIHAIFVVDPTLERILWLWGPSNLSFQHDPTLLPNGNILVFDNGTERSQIVEVDPRRSMIVWRFAPSSGFFSPARGSAQRLPNGNTLVTESDRGNVFEINPRGETVWRFQNPDISEGGMRSAIFRMTRFRPDELPFLKSAR